MSSLVSKKDLIAKYLLQLTIVVTIFSQMEAFSAMFRPLMYAFWFLLLGYSLAVNKGKICISSFTVSFLFCYSIFALFCLLQLWLNSDYVVASYLNIMLIPLMVSIVSNLLDQKLSNDYVVSICKTYVVCAVIFAAYINITFFCLISGMVS